MAYTIGSSKGKEIAKNMKAGETYKASDGSTWTKKSDGSVSVTHQGVTTNNAYKPSSGGGSSGGTTSKNTSSNVDYSALGKQQMSSGASWEDVLATYNARYNKASTTPGLEQYANDAIQNEMWQYIQNGIKEANSQKKDEYIEDFEYDEEKPTYDSQYDPAIQNLLNQILNREDFSYSAQDDPLYQQYAAMYRQEGDRAMRDTMAEAAASAGGMNSYAITAAQQANNYYNSQLNNKIPELYQLAYEMYLQDKESMVQDLGLLQSMDNTQYGRYRDTMQDFYNDKNFAYGLYKDAVTQGNWQQNFDYTQAVTDRNYNYNVTQGDITNEWRNKEWDNTLKQQDIVNSRYDTEKQEAEALRAKEEAQTQAFALLELGQMPPSALLQAAGIDQAYASAYLTGIKNKMNTSSSKSSGGSGGSGYTGNGNDKKKTNGTVIGLGIGPINNDTLERLILAGAVTGDENGNFYWSDGWSATNYKERLDSLSGFGNLLTLPMLK